MMDAGFKQAQARNIWLRSTGEIAVQMDATLDARPAYRARAKAIRSTQRGALGFALLSALFVAVTGLGAWAFVKAFLVGLP